ncbi:transposase [Streptomyces virginiae]
MKRGDLTDAQWARLEPLLPTGKRSGRPPIWTRRQLINGKRRRTRTGAPWPGAGRQGVRLPQEARCPRRPPAEVREGRPP